MQNPQGGLSECTKNDAIRYVAKCWLNSIMTQFVIISTKRRILWTMSTEKTNKKNLGRFTYEAERSVAAVKQFLFQLMMTLRWLSWYWQFHEKDETFFSVFFFYSLTASKLLYFMPYPKLYNNVGWVHSMHAANNQLRLSVHSCTLFYTLKIKGGQKTYILSSL